MRQRVLFVAIALALTGCKPASHPADSAAGVAANLPYERAEAVTWSDDQGAFSFGGNVIPAGRLWRFEDGPQSFKGQGSTVTFSPIDGTHLSNDSYDSMLRSPASLALNGAGFDLVLVRLTRLRNGLPWDGTMLWSTDAHGEAGDYQTKPFIGAEPMVNETVILAYDMARPRRGGDDWSKSIVQQIRLDTDNGAGGEFLLRQMAIVKNPAPDKLRLAPAQAAAAP